MGATSLKLEDWRGALVLINPSSSAPSDDPRLWLQIREDGDYAAVEVDEGQVMRIRDALTAWLNEQAARRTAQKLMEARSVS